MHINLPLLSDKLMNNEILFLLSAIYFALWPLSVWLCKRQDFHGLRIVLLVICFIFSIWTFAEWYGLISNPLSDNENNDAFIILCLNMLFVMAFVIQFLSLCRIWDNKSGKQQIGE